MTAKEFYENQLHDKTTVVGRLEKDEIIELMQAYHESKMREVTDEDILNKIQSGIIPDFKGNLLYQNRWLEGYFEGAKAMRDGEIKHNREV